MISEHIHDEDPSLQTSLKSTGDQKSEALLIETYELAKALIIVLIHISSCKDKTPELSIPEITAFMTKPLTHWSRKTLLEQLRVGSILRTYISSTPSNELTLLTIDIHVIESDQMLAAIKIHFDCCRATLHSIAEYECSGSNSCI